jgi:tetratricopeptide (TPR) repeat protein/transcriptional regulator with XRE-family HTH domain
VAEQAALSFGRLLRQLRDDAGLTQEELADAARVSQRAISDLERGINLTARKDTARMLADALKLSGPRRAPFEAAARGRAPASDVLAAGAPATSSAAATRTLPRDIASFTGRESELARLSGEEMDGGVVGIHAIGGMAGIGKTTFAVHAAHRLAGRFPDGQFFLPLHAHTPGQRPVDPADGLASLLLTAGVAAQRIPPGMEARAARWRDCVAGKKILLLLDDAAGHEQVRPLLPGTAGCLVLITSRKHLTALEDAEAISLDALPPGEAATLLARLAATADLDAGDAAAGEITRLCGYLPLAIGMLARQLHHHPAWTAAGLAADLATARDRLELMQAENLSVAAAFDLSYRDLTSDQQRLFRRLGLHPGPDIDAYAAAALDDTSLDRARRHLGDLYDHHLITEPTRGRYRLHDLLREHARGLAAAGDPADGHAAAGRLLDYYSHAALAAGRYTTTRTTADDDPPPGEQPAWAPQLSTPEQAAAWLETERPNLNAAAEYAAAHGFPQHAIALPSAMSGFLRARGDWEKSTTLHQAALSTARQVGDRSGQASALDELGVVEWLTGDYTAAAASHRQALDLHRDLGDQRGQAYALSHLGVVQQLTGDYRAAAVSQQQALDLYRSLGHLRGQAFALGNRAAAERLAGDYRAAAASGQQALALFCDLGNAYGQAFALANLGEMHRLTGDYAAAADSGHQALALYRDIGERGGEAEVLNNLGELLRQSSDCHRARDHHAEALAITREIGAPLDEARALEGIGKCHIQDDKPADGTGYLRQALAIYQRIGVPGAHAVREYLRDHGP